MFGNFFQILKDSYFAFFNIWELNLEYLDGRLVRSMKQYVGWYTFVLSELRFIYIIFMEI